MASTTPTNNLLIMTAGASLIPTIISKRQLRVGAQAHGRAGGRAGWPTYPAHGMDCMHMGCKRHAVACEGGPRTDWLSHGPLHEPALPQRYGPAPPACTHPPLAARFSARSLPGRCPQRAAEGGTLGSPVHKQMATACLLHSVLGLVVLAQAVSLRNPVLAASVGGLCGVATITMAYTLMKVGR